MPKSQTVFVRDHRRRFRVLVVLRLYETASQHKLAGLFAHLDTHSDWDLKLLRTQEELTTAALDEAVAEGLDGLIVSIAYDAALFRRIAGLKCPVVVLDSEPAELRRRTTGTVIIRNDAQDLARAALRAFATCGRFNSLAYVGSREKTDWSEQRARAFSRLAGGKAQVLGPTQTDADRPQLIAFLKGLELPAAVLAAYDCRAADVLAAAQEAGIDVPRELSILGIDNDPYVCSRTQPAIASLEPDFFGEGRAAARLLDKMMRAGKPSLNRHVTIGVKRLIQRGTLGNLPPAHDLLVRAREFIHKHATEGLTPQDVATHLRISRPLLDLRFREARKGTVGELITETKLAEVKRLLAKTDTPITQIGDLCGFPNPNALKNLFKRTTGTSMRDYRVHTRSSG